MTEAELLLSLLRAYGIPGLAIGLTLFAAYRAAQFIRPLITAISERLMSLLTRLIDEIDRNDKHRQQLLDVLTHQRDGTQELLRRVQEMQDFLLRMQEGARHRLGRGDPESD